jgi:competence protein ComEC
MALARIWLSVVALAAGVVAADGSAPAWIAISLVIVGAGTLARRRSAATLVGLAAIAFGCGWLAQSARDTRASPLEGVARRVPRCRVVARVVESAGGLGTLADVWRAECDGVATLEDAGPVVIDGEVGDAGAMLHADGWLVPLGGDGFDAARRDLGARAHLDVQRLSLDPPRTGVFAVAHAVREGLVRATAGLDARRAALLRGLAIGDTGDMDAPTVEAFRRAGLSHLVAVSGSNVAIVLGAIAYALRVLGPRARVAAGLAALVVFVAVVGPEPSVLRAAVMGAVALAGLVAGRRADPLHALGLALIALFAARPHLVRSVGLHLSTAATAGIVLWARSLAHRLAALPRPLALTLAATAAAQIAVSPVLVASFGELSVAAPVANVVAVPAVAPATVLGLAAAVTGAVEPGLGRIAARVADPLVGWVLATGDWFGTASWASLQVPRWWSWVLAAPVTVAGALAVAARGRVRPLR